LGVVKVTGNTVFRLTAAALDYLPGGVRSLAAHISALGSYSFSPGKRRNVRGNLSIVGSPHTGNDIFGIFRNHSMNIIEMFTSSRWDFDEINRRIEFPQRHVLDDALAAGKGAILATAHIGNWELPALLLGSLGYRLGVVAGEQMNSLLTDPVKRAKEEKGLEVFGPGQNYRKLYRMLREGGIVALLLDGDVFEGGTRLEFFGREVNLPRGAARLAMGTGTPVLGAYSRRINDERSRISMEMLLSPGEAGRIGEDAAQRRIFDAIERYIRANADQWCIFRRFWEGVA
jgi:KDO2-lipid IV(A) lauroyltransferase